MSVYLWSTAIVDQRHINLAGNPGFRPGPGGTLAVALMHHRRGDSFEVIRHNRDQAESLKEGSSFVFKDWTSKTGIYKTELLQEGINIMWFAN
ncbi:hypothetical protein BDR07DRAFT_1500164 [Suillus spraguei]|nr:hypothetical protein BDR07DRAFT_1500164 [Suillus spraguei]